MAERLRAGMEHFGYAPRGSSGGIQAFAKKYLGAADQSPQVSDWRKGRYLPGPEIMRAIAKDWGCTFDWLRFGDGPAPAWYANGAAQPEQIFTQERRAGDHVLALQLALESLTAAVMRKTPGVAGEFLSDLVPIAEKHGFATNAGLLGRLVGSAREVRAAEAKAARARRRAGPAARTKP